MGWTGWIAAVGGLASIIGAFVPTATNWLVWVGGIVAVVFGVWAALVK